MVNAEEPPVILREFIPADQPGVDQLQAEFMQEFFPEFADDPRQAGWNADVHDIQRYYLQAGGKFWVAEEAGEIVGVGGFRLASPGVAEIKRIRIQSRCRGKGLGKAILHEIEACCRDQGFSKILVDTDERLATAKAMYEKAGYVAYRVEREVEGSETYINYFFEKDLTEGLG